uniref:Uncharacterized protein n=1 Tax=Mycena chlorophos TaxID=658473 RepID=A0ABQ0LR79_MYCCL|nr:predicted protein [Mycena chlorophos]
MRCLHPPLSCCFALLFVLLLLSPVAIHALPAAGASDATPLSISSATSTTPSSESPSAPRTSTVPSQLRPSETTSTSTPSATPSFSRAQVTDPGTSQFPHTRSFSGIVHATGSNHPDPTQHHPWFPPPSQSSIPITTHHESLAALVFEIIGILAALVVAFSVIRCFIIYKRTPQRDRILNILHRHQLQREMEELERNPPMPWQRPSIDPPPPPYLRPPDYEDDSESALLSRPRADG